MIGLGKDIIPDKDSRRGRQCVQRYASLASPKPIQNIINGSFASRGPRLFNLIPKHVRELKNVSVDVFKDALDKYLALVPDQPQIQGYTVMRQADSNSLVDMHSLVPAQSIKKLEERHNLDDAEAADH